jgi:hypothetical protein
MMPRAPTQVARLGGVPASSKADALDKVACGHEVAEGMDVEIESAPRQQLSHGRIAIFFIIL